MKRYYRLLIALVLLLSVFLIILSKNNWKTKYFFGGELSWWVESFYYSERSSWGWGESFSISMKDSIPYLMISIKNLAFSNPEFSGIDKIQDENYSEIFELDPNILKEMEKIANTHRIWQREGNYVDKMVLDWDSWNFLMRFGDWERISAHGYMASPRGFSDGLSEFLAPFGEMYIQTKENADRLLNHFLESK